MNKKDKVIVDDVFLYKFERGWRASQKKYSEKELLKIFPEAKEIAPDKIEEWETKKKHLIKTIKEKLKIIKHTKLDDFSRFFWRDYVKIFDGEDLLETEKHITRLSRMLSEKRVQGRISENDIEKALQTPIENLINQPLKKCGNKLKVSCPFHRDKTPSFYIYLESNSFFCYSCQRGGNTINLVRSLYGYSFIESVKFINN